MTRRTVFAGISLLVIASLLPFFVLFAAEPVEGKKYALLVGVQKYDGTGLSNLKYAEKDMADLKAALEKLGYKVTLVTRSEFKRTDKDDLDPTAENIRDHLAAITRNRKPEDTVLVAFSGHGAHLKSTDKLYYCPAKSNLEKPETLVAIDDVMKALEPFDKGKQTGCNADNKVLLMDACRNDPSDGKGEDNKLASKTRPLIPDPPGGTVALFSCSKGQLSQESDKFQRGFLMHFVIDGLEGKAANSKTKQISWDKLVAHVKEEVPAAVVEEKGPKINQLPESLGRANVLSLGSLLAAATDETVEEFEWMGEKRKRTVKTLTLGGEKMEFVKIPAGSFMMGSLGTDKDAQDHEKPQHEVTLSKPLWVAKTPVTKAQFESFVLDTTFKTDCENGKSVQDASNTRARIEEDGSWSGSYPYVQSISPIKVYNWRNPGWKQDPKEPVVNVSWNDCTEFSNWLSKSSGCKIRLLTEAEFEYVLRGGTTTTYFSGDSPSDLAGYIHKFTSDKSNEYNYPIFGKAGIYKPNGFGLHDMTNTCWCLDSYDARAYKRKSSIDPVVKGNNGRVVRGATKGIRSASRGAYFSNITETSTRYDTGFRVCFTNE